jgi:predicted LPLAT superfamily acyltransferase
MSAGWREHAERGNAFSLWLIRSIALHLGRRSARILLLPITLYYFTTAHAQRRASRNYLRRVLDREPSALDVARHIHCFAATILDRVFFLSGRLDQFELEFDGLDALKTHLDTGIGCLLVGAHHGSFEALRALAVGIGEVPLKVLMYPEQNAVMTRVLAELNPEVANTVIPLGNIESLLRVRESLDEGQVVGLLGDRMGGSDKAIDCTLLGSPTRLPAGPGILAATTGAPTLLCLGLYLGGNRYRIVIEPLPPLAKLPRGERGPAVEAWVRHYAARLEHHVKETPWNWFNFYEYWPEDQPAAPLQD